MNFQDFLINTTTTRSGLKPSFNTGETPTQQNFHDMIDGLFLLQDDSIYKDANNGLAIRTGANDQALLFFDHDSQDLTWSVEIDNGLHIKDKDSNARLSVLNDGKVGVGTTSPDAKLHVHTESNGTLVFTTAALDQGTYERFSFYPYYVGGEYNVQGTTLLEAPKVGDVKANIHFSWRGGGEGLFIEGATNNVGIGTTSPSSRLQVTSLGGDAGGSTVAKFVQTSVNSSDANPVVEIAQQGGTNASALKISVPAGGDPSSYPNTAAIEINNASTLRSFVVRNGTGTRMFEIHSGGNATFAEGKRLYFNDPDGSYGFIGSSGRNLVLNSNWNGVVSLQVGNQQKAYLNNGGNLYVSNAVFANNSQLSSDRRLKKNIEPISYETITKLRQLQGNKYHWRTEEFKERNFSEGKQLGFIAQEMQEVFPELVAKDEKGYLSINYNGLIPVLTEAVKGLNNKNEALEARVLHLEQLLLNANTLN